MSDSVYTVGDTLFGFPIIEVNGPNVTIRLPTNITITADLSQGPVDLANLLHMDPDSINHQTHN